MKRAFSIAEVRLGRGALLMARGTCPENGTARRKGKFDGRGAVWCSGATLWVKIYAFAGRHLQSKPPGIVVSPGPIILDWLLARRRRHNGRYLCKPQGHSMRFYKQIRRGNAKNRARRRDTPGRVLPTKSASTSLCAFVDGAPSMLNVL